IEFVVVGDLSQSCRFHGVVHFAHRRVNRIDGNESQSQVLVEILVGGNVAAPTLQAHLHLQLSTFRNGGDVDVLVQYLNVAIGLDHARSDDSGLSGLEVDGFWSIAIELERDLLQVEDDVRGVLDYAGDGLELVQHAFNLHRGNGRALNRGQQHAPQGVA